MTSRLIGSAFLAAVLVSLGSDVGLAGQPGDGTTPRGVGAANPLALELLPVRTPSGLEHFYVSDADAPVSAAWRDETSRADKSGSIPEPTGGFELTNRVIVRAQNPAELLALLADAGGLPIEVVAGVRDFWVVRAGSVREAAALADEWALRPELAEVYLDVTEPWVLRTLPTDPLFSEQWHLNNDLDPRVDVNAEPAWDAGYTGAGVVIGIVESAWQHTHPDLADNYNASASQEWGTVTSHATSCAGVAAAVANNDLMGAGAAYGAQISGQIYGSSEQTAEALSYRNDLNDIKSNSWGPADTAMIYYMPSVIRSAIEQGIADGRDGLGEVFVWAAGNGGTSNDRVDYDPYVSSRYTIAVGAIGDADVRASFNEKGCSMLVVAPSSGNSRYIHTTTSNGGWTTTFGGTSAASPLATGAIALMLEANPSLTWRDVQHVLIESARKNDPNNAEWITNGAGFDVNYNYGFGAVDAGAGVALAASWVRVPHEVATDTGVIPLNAEIPDGDPNGVIAIANVTDDIRIESVELFLNVLTTRVGDLRIVLNGPAGTESVFAEPRSDTQDNYVNYRFTSLRDWGEPSAGDWTITIADMSAGDLATWLNYRLVVHGTPLCPGDLNEDGAIELSDLAALLGAYGRCEGEPEFVPAADFDNSGCIDLPDLAQLLSVYGQSCN